MGWALSRQDLRWTLAGASAVFVGVGVARFSFNPLFPAMVEAGSIDPAGGAYMGAFNLLGYLIGVLAGLPLSRHAGTARTLSLAMAATGLTFLACAFDLGLLWYCLWRFLAGVTGGVLMVLAGPVVQAVVAPAARGLAGGAVIAGVGSGVFLCALALPWLIAHGQALAWVALALLIVALWGLTVRSWPDAPVHPAAPGPVAPAVWRLALAYGVSGAGLVPHMVYLSDMIVRGRDHPTEIAALAWALFGLGGVLGTLAGGRMVDRIGGRLTVRVWLVLQLAAVILLSAQDATWLVVSGFLGGFAGLGLTAVVLGHARELSGEGAAASWRIATAGFAVLQTAGSFALAALFARTESHALLVLAGAILSALALVIMCLPRPASRT